MLSSLLNDSTMAQHENRMKYLLDLPAHSVCVCGCVGGGVSVHVRMCVCVCVCACTRVCVYVHMLVCMWA